MNEKLSKYPKTDKFEIIDTIGVPHSYCIGAKLVGHTSNHFGGILGEAAIISAEKAGIYCDICKGKLSYKEHKTALLVQVDDKRELKDIPELKEFLLSIKGMTEK
ncbi:MAG: hypothetical protein Q8K02_08110, partial [Flavobacterium sp.]|nr:hypothetical protein [Flavobacterium sp.]